MIEKEQREAERRPVTKITHKGEIEIENQEPAKAPEPIEPMVRWKAFASLRYVARYYDTIKRFFFIFPPQLDPPPKAVEVPEEKPPESKAESPKKAKDTTSLHKSHLFDLHCKICTGSTCRFTTNLVLKTC